MRPEGAIVVTHRAQVVEHRGARPSLGATYPFQWTTLTAGLMALGGLAVDSTSSAKVALLAAAGARDAYISADAGGGTGVELVLTTTFARQSSIVSQVSGIYYLEAAEKNLFANPTPIAPPPPPPQSREFKVLP